MNFLWFLILACFCNKNNAGTCKNGRRQTRNCTKINSQNTCCSNNNTSSVNNIPVSSSCQPLQNQGRPCGSIPNQSYQQTGNQNCPFQNFQNSSMQNQGYSYQPIYQASASEEQPPCPSITESVSSCQRCN